MDNSFIEKLNKRLKYSIIINLIFTVFELICGFLIGSLALISDASSNLADVFSLIISFTANKISQKAPNRNNHFGFGRATIFAALLNGIILFSLACYIIKESYYKFFNPEDIQGGLVMFIGFLGIIINGSMALSLKDYQNDVNIKSAFFNMIFDAIASLSALVGGFLILITKKPFIDSIIGSIIGLMLIIASLSIVFKCLYILFESSPKDIDVDSIKNIIKNIDFVDDISDIKLWTISSYQNAMIAKIKVKDIDKYNYKIIKDLKLELNSKYNISYSNIEIEN
jgi:cobalt-zinc-cadmium efflux system protein